MASLPTDDSVLAAFKHKLDQFKVKQLKDVLQQLGISKKGRKQELVHRIISLLSDGQDQVSKMNDTPYKKKVAKETVVKIVEKTFTKMQDPANIVGGSEKKNNSAHSVKPEKKSDDSAQLEVKICCPCGNSMVNDSMIKCADPHCNIWQHYDCVIIPEKPADNIIPELLSPFYCWMCRISRADPFWVTINHPLLPVSIAPSNIAEDSLYTEQHVEKTFLLSRADMEMLQKDKYDLQVWCILLNDKVPFRMHWPLCSNMRVNGLYVRVLDRLATQKLGANGRDDSYSVLTAYLLEGPNKIVLSRSDSRTFCLGVRIVKRRSLGEVLNLVPKEQDGENFDDALARVRRCVGGGTQEDNADSDSDIEVVTDFISVNLRCPITGSRIRTAGRFKPCVHVGCFDLEAFVTLNERSRKWQCPICMKNYSVDNIIIDPYFNRITSMIQSCGDYAYEIDVRPTGSWRVKGGPELKDLMQWHLPNGTLCTAAHIETKLNMGTVNHRINEERLSEDLSCLKLGIRQNNNGLQEISKSGDPSLMSSSTNDLTRNFGNGNRTRLVGNIGHNSGPREQDIIVLSDSDDDEVTRSIRPRSSIVITIDSDSD